MLHYDGEQLQSTLDTQQKNECTDFSYLGELLRTHVELEADELDHAQANAWLSIRDSIATSSEAKKPSAQKPFWEKLIHWMQGPKGYFAVAGLSAAAVAALFLMREDTHHHDGGADTPVAQISNSSSPAPTIPVSGAPTEVQKLEIDQGQGAIYSVVDDDGETTMIWIDDESGDEI